MSEGKKNILWKLKKKDSSKIYPNISFTILKTWIVEGRVQKDDLLCNSEQSEWKSAGKFSELQTFLGSIEEDDESLVLPEKVRKSADTVSEKDLGFGWKTPPIQEIELDMTSMMDCVFLLLIFFVVSATFAIYEVKNIQVPKASVTMPTKQEKITLTVSVDKDRQIYLGKSLVKLSDLKEKLIAEVNRTNQQDVILSADHILDYGFVVAVLDEVNAAGVKNVKLRLEKKQKP